MPAASRYAGIGPGGFPLAVGAGLVILGLLLARQIHRGEHFDAQESENADARKPANWAAFSLAFAAAVVPIGTLQTLGLPLTAMLSFTLIARSFGSRTIGWDLFSGLILGSLSWLLFDRLGLQLGGFFPLAGV